MQIKPRSLSLSLLPFLVIAVVLISACSRLTPDNVQKVQKGMSPAQVENIIGAPADQDTKSVLGISTTTYHYHTTDGDVTIEFVNDQVWLIDSQFNKQ